MVELFLRFSAASMWVGLSCAFQQRRYGWAFPALFRVSMVGLFLRFSAASMVRLFPRFSAASIVGIFPRFSAASMVALSIAFQQPL